MPRTSASELEADKAAALALTPVSRETVERLDRVVALLQDWQPRINLVAPSTLPKIWTRHIADSLQLLRLAPQARTWVDLGSGAGFPGLAVACALAESDGAQVHLVESDQRKAAFLREAARITQIPVTIHAQRIEFFLTTAVAQRPVDVVSARALAPLAKLLGYAAPLIGKGALALLPKGQDIEAELTEAAKYWNIEADAIPSLSDPKARILVVRRAIPRDT